MSKEKCDGNRNLLHMCVSFSLPSTNKDANDDAKARGNDATSSDSKSGLGRMSQLFGKSTFDHPSLSVSFSVDLVMNLLKLFLKLSVS